MQELRAPASGSEILWAFSDLTSKLLIEGEIRFISLILRTDTQEREEGGGGQGRGGQPFLRPPLARAAMLFVMIHGSDGSDTPNENVSSGVTLNATSSLGT